jgi:hypothetical protein
LCLSVVFEFSMLEDFVRVAVFFRIIIGWLWYRFFMHINLSSFCSIELINNTLNFNLILAFFIPQLFDPPVSDSLDLFCIGAHLGDLSLHSFCEVLHVFLDLGKFFK